VAAHYEIIVRGRLGVALVRSFDDLEVRAHGPQDTRLAGWFADQAALHGLLSRLGDLGLELSLVRRLPATDDELTR
jgi:hypothetical protein